MATIQNPISEIRATQQISRTELARRSAMPYVTLSYLETGLGDSIKLKTAEKLAKIADKSAEEIQAQYAAWRQQL